MLTNPRRSPRAVAQPRRGPVHEITTDELHAQTFPARVDRPQGRGRLLARGSTSLYLAQYVPASYRNTAFVAHKCL
jgi:hypothetical protein